MLTTLTFYLLTLFYLMVLLTSKYWFAEFALHFFFADHIILAVLNSIIPLSFSCMNSNTVDSTFLELLYQPMAFARLRFVHRYPLFTLYCTCLSSSSRTISNPSEWTPTELRCYKQFFNSKHLVFLIHVLSVKIYCFRLQLSTLIVNLEEIKCVVEL